MRRFVQIGLRVIILVPGLSFGNNGGVQHSSVKLKISMIGVAFPFSNTAGMPGYKTGGHITYAYVPIGSYTEKYKSTLGHIEDLVAKDATVGQASQSIYERLLSGWFSPKPIPVCYEVKQTNELEFTKCINQVTYRAPRIVGAIIDYDAILRTTPIVRVKRKTLDKAEGVTAIGSGSAE